jgi:hypothetical protein
LMWDVILIMSNIMINGLSPRTVLESGPVAHGNFLSSRLGHLITLSRSMITGWDANY